MVVGNEFYQGSTVLNYLADLVSLPIDQLNFMVCQVLALCLAFPFRTTCSVENVGVTTRHVIEIVLGVLLAIFCFGYQIWHLLAQSVVSYIFMASGQRFSHVLVFAYSMIYLSVCHVYRQIYDYGGYTLDITGPLMIQTQKLTSLAFSLHDGRFKDWSSLKQDQKDQAVRRLPSIIEYLSYLFYFHGIMVGPLTFFNDYIAFIDGTNFIRPPPPYPGLKRKHPADGLNTIVLTKLAIASVFCVSMMTLPHMLYPPEKLISPEYFSLTFLERMIYILGVTAIAKHKYYFAWVLADAINNAAGFGFSGYDNQGNAVWDLTYNVDIIGVEFCTSLKKNIESWNITTELWLRRVVYERFPFRNTLAVFACSAVWHGFYPGYYLTFGSGALLTLASRQVRHHIRPWFQQTSLGIYTYEVITFIATRLANGYLSFPFLMLEFYTCLNVYKSLYCYYHIIATFGLFYFKFANRQSHVDETVFQQVVHELSQLHKKQSKDEYTSPSDKMKDDSQGPSHQNKDSSAWANGKTLDSCINRKASLPEMTTQGSLVDVSKSE